MRMLKPIEFTRRGSSTASGGNNLGKSRFTAAIGVTRF
jgi:hypothetical protein